MSILDYFPYDKPREGQRQTLLEVERNIDKYDVFVIDAPVASGKSGVAVCIQRWLNAQAKSTTVVTNNNILRDQYLDDFDSMITVKAQTEYWLEKHDMTVKEFKQKIYKYGPKGNQYDKDRKDVTKSCSDSVVNSFTYMAHRLQRHCVIFDEAHTLLPYLRGLHARRLWTDEHQFPHDARTPADLLIWLNGIEDKNPLQERLKTSIETLAESTIFEFARENYRGDPRDCLKIIPLDVSEEPPVLWPAKVKKVVLLSATIGPADIKAMGLGLRRVKYIKTPSPIPYDRRPVKFCDTVNMSMRFQDDSVPKLAEAIKELASLNAGRGFVHATYSVAKKLREYLSDDPRFIFHTRSNKRVKFEQWCSSDPDMYQIFIGSGMTEGIDLSHDTARWQVLTKVPYPSLMSPAFRYLAKENPELYAWETSKEILQASGRICRGPNDYGVTYCLDSSFRVWYDKASETLPDWFQVENYYNAREL